MKLIAKILGLIIGFILYPFFWMLEWILLFVAEIFKTLENLMGKETDEIDAIEELKAEADKVIAELKKEKQYVIENTAKVINAQEREIRHQKYKRCLVMAERCKYRMYYLSSVVDYESSKLFPNPTAIKRYTKKESRMDYWKNRWLELAEQFKEGV